MAWQIFEKCQRQMRCSFGGIIGFDFLAFQVAAGALDIEIDEFVLDQLSRLESLYMNHLNPPEE